MSRACVTIRGKSRMQTIGGKSRMHDYPWKVAQLTYSSSCVKNVGYYFLINQIY